MKIEEIISGSINELKPYVAGKTIAEVKEQYRPEQVSKLASNENRLGCSPKVEQAVLTALKTIQDYPDPYARKLRKEIARKNGVKEPEVILAAGSESIISILCRTFFSHNDNAVTANATFVGFFVQAEIVGVTLKKVPVTHDYKFDVNGLLEAIDNRTKMVYIANPNNPTGTYLNRNEFEKLVDEVPGHVLLIVDEAYFEYARNIEDYPVSLPMRKPNVITLRTFSKAYGLAGMRVGYAIAYEDVVRQMMKTKLTFEPSAPAQAAALVAIHDEEFIQESVNVVKKGREKLYDFFDRYGVNHVRSISNSVMMILDNEDEAVRFTQKMLEQGVILRRVNAFGLPNCVRITIGTEKEMDHFEKSFLRVKSGK